MVTRQSVDAEPLSLILLFDALPELAALSGGGCLQVSEHVAAEGALHALVELGGHRFRLVGFDHPAPQEAIGHAIDCAHWQAADKAPLREHRSHVLCYYEGDDPDPAGQIAATWELANRLGDEGLLGLVDTEAWNCLPAHVLRAMVEEDALQEMPETIPVGLWTGFVKFFRDDGAIWFCSKGNHRWGVCDFAFLGTQEQADDVFGIFRTLFHYAREGARLKVGDTATVGIGELVRFVPVAEFADYLEGPLGTLVLHPIHPGEIH